MMNKLQVLKNETLASNQGMTPTERPSTQILVHNMSSQGNYHASGTPHPSPVSTKNTPASGRARWNPPMTQRHLQQQPAVQQRSSGTPELQPPPPRPSLSNYNSMTESSYRGTRPTIPNFVSRDPTLNDKFGQPHQIALKRIATVMDSPDISRGDTAAFEKFALQIQSLVGILQTLGLEGEVELQCGSHVARLLSKLPPEQRAAACFTTLGLVILLLILPHG
ncbi:hypothetical protein AOLI_G00063040 [Acnodon oligacanthus]